MPPLFATLKLLVSRKRPEPSYPTLPEVDESTGETNVPGIYAAGELAGTPLVKLGLNAGHDLVGRIAPELQANPSTDQDQLDVVIVGSGSSGYAATLHAHKLGLKYVTLEAAAFANTFVTMTKGKWLFAEPVDVKNRSYGWFEECTKEDLLENWRQSIQDEGLLIQEQEKVVDVKGDIDNFTVVTDVGEYKARRILLCLGKAGNPRKLRVPGEKENADKVHHRLLDPDDFNDEDILIVGAGDVACEAAIALAGKGTNRVAMSAIDKEFTFPKKRNIDAVRALEAEGKLDILLSSSVKEIGKDNVVVDVEGERRELKNSVVFEMIGAELPLPFLKKIGVRLAGSWHWKKWAALVVSFLAIYSLYALKSYGKGATAWPFEGWISPETYDGVLAKIFSIAFTPFAWLFSEQALADIMSDRSYQQGFLYSGLYTVVMLVFGYEALIRWRKKARDKRYQTWRYISLLSFQVGFFLIVNIVAVQALTVKYAWRAWGLYQPFPLFFNTFFWWYDGDPKWIVYFFVGAGAFGSLIAIPIAARNHGKRFCTWVCGCGGLAETLGDRWRHLSPKGDRSRAWEFQAVAVFLASVLVGVIVVGMYNTDGNNSWWRAYNYLVDFWLVAVIPIALYPFFGGKVWCRYWCPLAAYNQLLSKWYGRLKIVSNDKCITCTECSKYCQVGVDVMAFAKNQQPFDNSNSACIHCGICIDVCPMDVLSFETSDPKATELIKIGVPSAEAVKG